MLLTKGAGISMFRRGEALVWINTDQILRYVRMMGVGILLKHRFIT